MAGISWQRTFSLPVAAEIMNSFASPTGRLKMFELKEYIHSPPSHPLPRVQVTRPPVSTAGQTHSHLFSLIALPQYVFETCNRHRKSVWPGSQVTC